MALVNRVQLATSIPKELAEWLTLQAERERRTKSRIIETLLEEYKQRVENEQKNN